MTDVFFNKEEPVAIVTCEGFGFPNRNWDQKIISAVKKNPKCIVMPACHSVGEGSFRGLAYGGFLDITEVRGGIPIVLEPRWNLGIPEGGVVGCAIGGVYAFHKDWYRNIGGCSGMKGGGIMDLVAISLKTRLAGGSCIVLRDVIAEQEFKTERITSKDINHQLLSGTNLSYSKIRLAMTSLPWGISIIVPTLLTGTPGLEKAMMDIMDDIKEIHQERECFEDVCGCSLTEAAAKAGITFGPFQKHAEF